MIRIPRLLWSIVIGLSLMVSVQEVQGQGLFTRARGLTGMVARGYSFRPGLGIRTVSQWTLPVATVVPLGPGLTADISGRWAYTRITTDQGAVEDLSGFTDTDVRLTYTLGGQQAVLSLVASLPTGLGTVSQPSFLVVGAVGSDFLTLPVSTYGTGAKITGGFAVARSLGGLNVGLGGSVRWSGEYEPFENSDLAYEPGIETRLQLGADGLVGSGRLAAGLTFSTFGDDNFVGAGGVGITQTFVPGKRFVGELSYVGPLGKGTVNLFAWNFHRSEARLDASVVAGSTENIFDLGVGWRLPAGARVSATPQVEFKQWHRDGSVAGRMGSFQLAVEIDVSTGITLEWTGLTEFGALGRPSGPDIAVQGWGTGLLARIGF